MEIELRRDCFTDRSTLGTIACGEFRCESLELPYFDGANLIGRSAILEGRYEVTLYYSPHLQLEVMLLADVPGRSLVEMHPANVPEELRGCIAPAMERGADRVDNSRPAFLALRDLVRASIARGEPVFITIRHADDMADDAGSSARA